MSVLLGNHNSHQAYQQVGVETASPGKLVIMLYEGMLRFLAQAKKSLEEKEVGWQEEVNNNIIKTQNVLLELMAALNREKGGIIAENLRNLYTYIFDELTEANLSKEKEKVEKVLPMLIPLKEAWEEAEKTYRKKGVRG